MKPNHSPVSTQLLRVFPERANPEMMTEEQLNTHKTSHELVYEKKRLTKDL